MPRSVDGTRRKDHRKKILKLAKGYRGRRSTNHKAAKDAVAKGLMYAYRDRRDKKPTFRRLWIARINAVVREEGMSYNRFIEGLVQAKVAVDRKMLADIAVRDPAAFKAIIEQSRSALAQKKA